MNWSVPPDTLAPYCWRSPSFRGLVDGSSSGENWVTAVWVQDPSSSDWMVQKPSQPSSMPVAWVESRPLKLIG